MTEPRPTPSRLLRNLNQGALLVVIAATAALLLRPSDDEGLLGLPELIAGDRAPRSIKAPRDFAIEDPATTERLREEAAAEVLPIFDLSTDRGVEAKSRIERAFAEMAPEPSVQPAPEGLFPPSWPQDRALADNFMRALQLYFDERELEALFRGGFTEEVRDAAIMVVRSVHEQRIAEDKDVLRLQAPTGLTLRALTPEGLVEREETVQDLRGIIGVDAARASIDELVAKKLEHLAPPARRAVALLAKRMLRPNVIANSAETQARDRRARESVRPVVIPIKRGEIVVRAGETVGERHLLIVESMARELEGESRLQLPAGSALLVVLLIVLLYRLHRDDRRRFLANHRDLAFAASVFVATLLLNWASYYGASWLAEALPLADAEVYRFLAPAAFGAVLVRFVLGREVAAAFIPLTALSAGLGMDHGLSHAVYALAGGVAAASLSDDADHPRGRLLLSGLAAGVAQAAALAALAMLDSHLVSEATAVAAAVALCSGLLSGMLALMVLPAVDVLFGYTSPLKLDELANLNHPLLRDLVVQAPGTYHHSIVVGALAEAGARAVGADPLLARVGGYYHDVGKLKNPRLFSENAARRVGDEHRSATPARVGVTAEEAAELRMHVADGLEIGARHRLGQPILEIIAQHHGTGRVRRVEPVLTDLGVASIPPVPAEALRYAGPRPQGSEAALVMLADRVEAAAEAMLAEAPLEEGMLEGIIERVVQEAVSSNELADCPLTLQDLQVVSAEFAIVLREILRRRGRAAATGTVTSELPTPALVRASARDDDRPN